MEEDRRTVLGIEFGSTRIKAVMLDSEHKVISSADYKWQSELKSGIWTYKLSDVWSGLKFVLREISCKDSVCCVGISGMMHGYLPFDKDWNLLTDFRTWQNTITEEASTELSSLFNVNIPQRWSISHYYQAILNHEDHVKDVAHITTLSGYVHFMLTGKNVVGIGEASGMFPIDNNTKKYDNEMLSKFNALLRENGIEKNIELMLPSVLLAGQDAGCLTKEGSQYIDSLLAEGVSFAPPEGDAGTGMVATNSVAPFTGNVSAGTSIFSMIVLEKPLKKAYREIDMVTTPSGNPVAMVHCNNCTRDLNDWVALFIQAATAMLGTAPDLNSAFTSLYSSSLNGDIDCGGIVIYNYIAGEEITRLNEGRPFILRCANSNFNICNFIRAHIYSAFATLRLGLEILSKEGVVIKSLVGHGGLFKTPGVAQRYLAGACNTPVTCMQTAGDGGPYGMALLAAYSKWKRRDEDLEHYLAERVFPYVSSNTLLPGKADVDGFNQYIENFRRCIHVELAAIESLPNK